MHGISFSELLVLHALSNAPDQKMRRIDLADAVSLTGSGITRMLKPMEKIGLVDKEANPRDARVSLVKLSKTGKRLHKEAWASFENSASTLLASLTDRQLTTFAELVARAN